MAAGATLYPAAGHTALAPDGAAAETDDLWSTIAVAPLAARPPPPPDRRRWLWLSAASGALLLILAGGLIVVVRALTAREPAPAPAVAEHKPPSDPAPESFDHWTKAVAELPAEEQVEQVVAKLKERNPGFDGQVKPEIANGVVVGLSLATEKVTDLSPVRALPKLKSLFCAADQAEHGLLADLGPLTGMGLTSWNVNGNLGVHDLSPLRGMPLHWLHIGFTTVDDLLPCGVCTWRP
jgi:hypothetical protein